MGWDESTDEIYSVSVCNDVKTLRQICLYTGSFYHLWYFPALIYSFTFSEYYLVRISFTESGREKIIPIYAFGNDNGFFDLEYFDLPNIDSNDKISPYITLDNIQLLGRVVRASAIPNKQ